MSTYAALTAVTAEMERREIERRREALECSMRQLRSPVPFAPAPLPEIAKRAVARYSAAGIRLFVTAKGELCASPGGQLSPEDMAFLSRHKPEIIGFLQSSEVIP